MAALHVKSHDNCNTKKGYSVSLNGPFVHVGCKNNFLKVS